MKVSMIVPVYNAEHVLFDTLGNLVHQTFFDRYPEEGEILFVNDCSRDRSGAILEVLHSQFPDRTRIIHLTENRGPGGARNVGVENSTGEFYLFMDCDDIAAHSLMEDLYLAVTEHNPIGSQAEVSRFDSDQEYDIAIAGLNCRYLNWEGFALTREFSGVMDEKKKSYLIASEADFRSKIYRRSFMEKYQIRFAERVMAEDEDFSAIVHANVRKVNVINKILVEIRDVEHSASKSLDIASTYEDILNCAIRAYQGMRKCRDYDSFAKAAETLYLRRFAFCLKTLDGLYQDSILTEKAYFEMVQTLRKLSDTMITHSVEGNEWSNACLEPWEKEKMILFLQDDVMAQMKHEQAGG